MNCQLQQFRQKKDGKGSSSAGKNSKKLSKLEQDESDADAATSVPVSAASSHNVDEEVEVGIDSNLSVTDSSGLQSVVNSSIPEVDAPSVDSSSVDVAHEANITAELASSVESEIQDQGAAKDDSQLAVLNEGENSQDAATNMGEVNFEGGAMDDHTSTTPVNLSSATSVAAAESGATTIEREGEERKEALVSSEKIFSTSPLLTREDQVTDVGCALLLPFFI